MSFLDIANAIRSVTGKTNKIKPSQFHEEIKKLAYVKDGAVTGIVPSKGIATPKITVDTNTGVVTAQSTQEAGYVNSGTTKSTTNLPALGSQTITPTTTDQVITKGSYLTGNQTIKGDDKLKSDNILRGTYTVTKADGTTETKRLNIFGIEGTVDKIHKVRSKVLEANIYGEQVADVARSYHLARRNGNASFQYNQNNIASGGGRVTDANGNCLIDCSLLGGLAIRGVPFKNSPFASATGKANVTVDADILVQLGEQSEYVWVDPYLDRQIDPYFKDLGRDGYYSVRTASQIAEYFYAKGLVLYEYKEFEESPTSVPGDLAPGDLIFWSKPEASEQRFKAISHIGVVSRDTTHYIQVTGDPTIKGDTVFNSLIGDHLQYISLIVRPNYCPMEVPTTPLDMELLPQYAFDDLITDASETKDTLTFVPQATGGVKVTGTIPSDNITFYVRRYDRPIILVPGTYKLSGTPVHPNCDVNSTSEIWGITIKRASDRTEINDTSTGKRIWDRGAGCEFTIDKEVAVYVYISVHLDCSAGYTFVPSLKRLS